MVTLVRLVCHFAGSWENETRMARICGMQGLKTNAWEISVESVLNHTCFPLGPRTPLVKLYVFKRKKESRMRRTHLLFRPPYSKEHFFPPEANKVATSRVVSTIFHYNIETQTAVFFFGIYYCWAVFDKTKGKIPDVPGPKLKQVSMVPKYTELFLKMCVPARNQ